MTSNLDAHLPPEATFIARFRQRARLTWVLLVFTLAYSTLALLDGRLNGNPASLIEFGAKDHLLIASGDWWRLLTAAFLHQGVLHLAINGYALWILGSFCEVMYGRARFLLIYVGAALGGSLASNYLTPQNAVGASGAIFGLLGAALVFGFRHRSRIPALMGRRLRGSLMFWLVVNLALGAIIPVIDNWGHLGGLAAGTLIALILGDAAFARPGPHVFLRAAAVTAAGFALLAMGLGIWNRLTVSYPTLAAWVIASQELAAEDPVGALATLEEAAASARGREPWLLLIQLEHVRALEAIGAGTQAAAMVEEAANGAAFAHARHPWAGGAADQFMEWKRYADAERLYRRVLATSNSPEAANNLAWMYLTAADSTFIRPAAALPLAERAVAAEPENPFYLGTLGTAQLRLWRHQAAAENLLKAIHLHEPGNEGTDLYLLTIALAGMGHGAQAETVLEEAVEHFPEDPFREEAERALRRKSLAI